MKEIRDPREKNLSPERLREVREIKRLAKKIKDSWLFNDVPYAWRD